MELLAVGLIGAFIFLGPEDIEEYLQFNQDDQQEQIVEIDNQSNYSQMPADNQELSALSKQYDPLEPDSMYVEPEISSLMIAGQELQSQNESSRIDQAAAKLGEITEPIMNWYQGIKQENQVRVDRHTFMRNRNLLD